MPLLELSPELICLIAKALATAPGYHSGPGYYTSKYAWIIPDSCHGQDPLVSKLIPLLLTNRQLNAIVTPVIRQFMRREKDTLLVYAAYTGDSPLTLSVLDLGADVKTTDASGRTALHWAAYNHDAVMVAALLERGARVTTSDKDRSTALHLGAQDEAVLKLLLNAGADANATNFMRLTPLDMVVRSIVSDEFSHVFHQHGVAPFDTQPSQAVAPGITAAIQLLLENGAALNRGDGLLHIAAREGNDAMIDMLLRLGVPINAPDERNFSPLDSATVFGQQNVAEKLIKLGAKYTANVDDAMESAIAQRSAYGIRVYSGYGISLQQLDSWLSLAIAYDSPDVLKELLHLGADPNHVTSGGETPLRTAAAGQDLEIVKILVEWGALIDYYSPLQAAAEKGLRPDIVKFLLNRGAKVDMLNNEGMTPLYSAVLHSAHPDITKLLIKHGANTNMHDNDGCTSLHIAVKMVNIKHAHVKLLLENGANINARTNCGRTPLMEAVEKFSPDAVLVQLLLDHGAYVDDYDNNADTVLMMALSGSRPNEEVIRALLESGATLGADLGVLDEDVKHLLTLVRSELRV